jgi:hypothetical protein
MASSSPAGRRAAAPRTRRARRATREQPPFGTPAIVCPGAADALQQRRDAARRADLADEIDVADVDAELERRGRDERRSPPAFSRSRRRGALLRQAAVVRRDGVSPSRSLRWRATRSASRRVFTKTSVVRCAR